jgi:outer membrane protein assembly factor BamB
MRVLVVFGSSVAFAVFLHAAVCLGDSYKPKKDNLVVCLDLRTGKVVWEYVPDKLGYAHFELYKEGLFVQRSTPRGDYGGPLYLDPGTGKPVNEFKRNRERLLTRSPIMDDLPVVLENGWRMVPFSSEQDMKTLRFLDATSAMEIWNVQIGDSVQNNVSAWRNFVFYALNMYSSKGVLYAYQAGAKKPSWTLDLNDIVKSRKEPFTRIFFQVIEDTLYVQSHEHVFAVHPENGKLLWHRNLSTDLRMEPDGLYAHGCDWATMAKAGDILTISYQQRVVALDLKEKKYLWHLEPDTFPSTPYPIARDGKLYLSSGAKRKLTVL